MTVLVDPTRAGRERQLDEVAARVRTNSEDMLSRLLNAASPETCQLVLPAFQWYSARPISSLDSPSWTKRLPTSLAPSEKLVRAETVSLQFDPAWLRGSARQVHLDRSRCWNGGAVAKAA